MPDDITLLYYTAHSLPDDCAERVRQNLLEISQGLPIISVSQRPLDFGENICVGEIGQSYYNCHKQRYIGAQRVKTKYVACCEDDSLYNMEHFRYRPSDDQTFAYNKSMWYLEKDRFWHKWQTGMFACIAPTQLLVDNLAARFAAAPEEPFPRRSQRHYWDEPGKDDGAKFEYFETKIPLITFNYFSGLGGKTTSRTHKPDERTELPYWGTAKALKEKYWDGIN